VNQPTDTNCVPFIVLAFLAFCAFVVSQTGCASAPDLIRNLGDDHASVRIELVSPYTGTQKLSRVNPGPGQTAKIGVDGSIETSGAAEQPK
jgi:hypothetical protein